MSSDNCSIPCNLCGSTDVEELSLVDRDSSYLRTVICTNCGLVWSDPRPDADAIKNYYTKDYRIAYKGRYTPKLKHVYRAGDIAKSRYSAVKNLLSPSDSILDVGAGGGEFVYLMRELGFDARGIEPNEGYGNYAKDELGLPVEIGFIQQATLPDDFYHLVTIHHVLEHLDDPRAVLEKVRRSMRENGVLAIEVPNVEGVCFAPRQRFHNAHLYSFNSTTLRLIGESAGFSIESQGQSEDGGVITAIFRKTTASPVKATIESENFNRIASVVRSHSARSYYSSKWPYTRRLDKLRRYFNEREAIRSAKNGREVLESVFASKPT
ncbi:MAG: methyltransferase domain-containing protein [Acidobacteria bacterium]|nr:methyltransferase domain-containing protein [Acidobacteriota bacterium]MBK8147207.1 methyltransferase domain-containing protein [Acidobacteriota bacterium]